MNMPTPTFAAEQRINLLGTTREQLTKVLEPVIDRSFRIDQIYRGIHESGAESFSEITALPTGLRLELDQRYTLQRPAIDHLHESEDGTAKYLFRLDDGATIEVVDIPDGSRRTLCISSQAGCALACQFCVTGYWGAGRDLTAAEIIGQVMAVESTPRPETHGLNLVFMGMGEPLLNLDNLKDALDILMERISWRRITVSTAGVIPGLEAMAGWSRRPQLAISLHAPDEARRSQLMPINQRYPLAELIPLLRDFPLVSKERITFEYLMLHHFNDELADADALVRLLDGVSAKVNLIPLNPDPVLDQRLEPSPASRVAAFRDRLRQLGMVATIRQQRGDDVSAACGQLRAPGRAPRGFRRSNLSF